MKEQVEVWCRRCARSFFLDRATYESAKDLWDDEHPWCPDCVRETLSSAVDFD